MVLPAGQGEGQRLDGAHAERLRVDELVQPAPLVVGGGNGGRNRRRTAFLATDRDLPCREVRVADEPRFGTHPARQLVAPVAVSRGELVGDADGHGGVAWDGQPPRPGVRGALGDVDRRVQARRGECPAACVLVLLEAVVARLVGTWIGVGRGRDRETVLAVVDDGGDMAAGVQCRQRLGPLGDGEHLTGPQPARTGIGVRLPAREVRRAGAHPLVAAVGRPWTPRVGVGGDRAGGDHVGCQVGGGHLAHRNEAVEVGQLLVRLPGVGRVAAEPSCDAAVVDVLGDLAAQLSLGVVFVLGGRLQPSVHRDVGAVDDDLVVRAGGVGQCPPAARAVDRDRDRVEQRQSGGAEPVPQYGRHRLAVEVANLVQPG